MPEPFRTAAQQRADEIRDFGEELARLEREGVVALTPAQREAISAHHRGLLAQFAQDFDIDCDARAKQRSADSKCQKINSLGPLQ